MGDLYQAWSFQDSGLGLKVSRDPVLEVLVLKPYVLGLVFMTLYWQSVA